MIGEIILDTLVVSAAGGLISLDRTAAFQTMVSRPIVASPLIGFFLGDVATSLIVGVVLELLFIGELPLGGHVPLHETGLSAAATAVAIKAADVMGLKASTGAGGLAAGGIEGFTGVLGLVPFVLASTVPISFLYRKADTAARRFNVRFFRSALGSLDRDGDGKVVGENLKGLGPFFLANFLALFATVLPLEFFAALVLPVLGLSLTALSSAPFIALGIAAGVNAIYTGRGIAVYSATALSAAFIWFLLI